MFKLASKIPARHTFNSGVTAPTSDIDTGGYDVLIGGHGFRLATDQQMPYERGTEATTTHRYDSSLEPGEQTLSPIPWIKSQASFHAGAGQLNLEQGFTAFQYQAEQVEHIRFDNCLGVNVWTPGQVTRLPDCRFFSFGFTSSCVVTATVGGIDYAIIGGNGNLYQAAWTSGPDANPVLTAIDLTSTTFGGAANCNITSLATDGASYYGVLKLTAVGSTPGVLTYIIRGTVGSTAAPTPIYDASAVQAQGVVGWAKARLVGALAGKLYELDANAAAHTALPSARYTHPTGNWQWTAISESPSGILAAGYAGAAASILGFTLDSSGGTPILSGGETAAKFPAGDLVLSLTDVIGSFLAIGSTRGIRIGTFDTYTGALKLSPISVTTTQPVLSVASRDRFVYGSYTNQQADGKTGLVALDLSMVIDAGGRNAYAPDLRPPTTAPTGLGAVTGVALLPNSNRLMFLTQEGIHIEGSGPGSDGDAWLRTSRIRYDTTEMKLFKLGRVTGTLDVANIQVTGIAPFASSVNLGTFGFLPSGNPGEFRLPGGLNEWIQLQFDLQGSACKLNSYQVKAIPAPKRQHIITLTVNCFRNETDKYGLDVTDPQTPRQRFKNLQDLEALGNELRYVEFTNTGAVAELVVIDQLAYRSFSRPSIDDDFGGYITMRLRTTET